MENITITITIGTITTATIITTTITEAIGTMATVTSTITMTIGAMEIATTNGVIPTVGSAYRDSSLSMPHHQRRAGPRLEALPYLREAWNHSTNFGIPSAIFVCGL
jgi:hypothetical protein